MTVTKLWRIWALSLVAVSLSWLILREFAPGEDQAKAAVRHSTRPPAVSPAPRPVDPSAALASLSSSTLWGPIAQRTAPGQPAAGASEPSTPKWSLSGYYDDSGTRYVIVSFEQLARPSQQLKLHDKLPDGARIEAIEPDRVRVRAPRINSLEGTPAEASPSASSGWLPITPGLPLPTSNKQR